MNHKKTPVKGYKVFNSDWTCRGFQYKVGHTYTEKIVPKVCCRGFHFCQNPVDCFRFYSFDPKNKVAEIIALGEIDNDLNKSCTNKIKIVREISWIELLEIINVGKENFGHSNAGDNNYGNGNTGNQNVGADNSGNRNHGNSNTGYCNFGDYNAGNSNIGDYNCGHYNIGDYNCGTYNFGHFNCGDCNRTNFSNGCFNTEPSKIYMFNKPTNLTLADWFNSKAYVIIQKAPISLTDWVPTIDKQYEHGFLRIKDTVTQFHDWWISLPASQQDVIKSLPNFDAQIFKEITGIAVD